jgi:protein-tyrosine phosphatase
VATSSLAQRASTPRGKGRHLDWPACQNARDLGGLLTAEGRRVRWGALVRADVLTRLTDAGRRALLAHGVRTVVDLRAPRELLRLPSPFANHAEVEYLPVPVQPDHDPEAVRVMDATDDLVEVYRVIVDRYAAGFAAAARAVARARPGGVIVHCHAGKDRTGILVALVLELLGVPRTTIARDYALTDRRLVQHYAAELSELAHDPVRRERLRMFQHTRTSTMRALLDHVAARHGGAAAYLCSGGLGHADTERLRARLLA